MSPAQKNRKQRRRVIKLMAMGAVASVTSPKVYAAALGGKQTLHEWYGTALGADVSLQLYHENPDEVQRIISKAVKIMEEMEGLFSLYQDTSLISRLNRDGMVNKPSLDFIDLLRKAQDVSQVTSGAFDITIQPLWKFLQRYFTEGGNSDRGDFETQLNFYRDRVDHQKLKISEDQVSFDLSGMAVTLNGIAQGYITDRVSEYLKSEGLTAVLIDMGEYRALGPQAGQMPWRIGLADPVNFGQLSEILEINEGAVATSSGLGEIFEPRGLYHHIINPFTGKSSDRYLSVTVTADEATLADALSTAFCSLSEDAIGACLDKYSGTSAYLTQKDGTVVKI